MRDHHRTVIQELVSSVSKERWRSALDAEASRYHLTALWIAVIVDPVFVFTDYVNIPAHWKLLLGIRLLVSFITVMMIIIWSKYELPSYLMVVITFFMISLQNAYTYAIIDSNNFLGQNINYMALMIGASIFLMWPFIYSVIILAISGLATAYFMSINPLIKVNDFFIQGGLLLLASAIFMMIQIRTRYNLTVKEIKACLALKASHEEIQAQAEKIESMNDNLESLIMERTLELQRKNETLEECAFINAHKLRGPVASILGLMNLMTKQPLSEELQQITAYIKDSTEKLNETVTAITEAIEKDGNSKI